MTQEEALNIITIALAPESLTPLQINVFKRAWDNLSYEKIAAQLNHDYSYITDVGSELWKLLSQVLGIKVRKVNLQDALARYAQQQQMSNLSAATTQHNCVDWGEAPDTSQFCGREEQLNTLEQWVVQDRCRAIAIVGIGGIGKTMLVTRLTQQLADTNMFEVVVWRSLQQAPPFVDFLTELMSAISPEQSLPLRLDAMIRQLLEQLRHHRCLLILDNVEAVMRGGELVGTYQPGYEDYGRLFQQLGAGRHQSTVLLTSREIPAEVAIQQGLTSPVRLLRLTPLSSEEGKVILAVKGLIQAEQPQVKELIKRYQGNPLALEIVATPIKELFNSNIAAFLAQEALLFKEIRGVLAQQFNRLSSLEQQVMYWLAINQKPVTAAQLQADIMPSVSLVELRDALVSLDRRSLIEKIKLTSVKPTTRMKLDCLSYTQQPVVMEYVTEQLIEQVRQEVTQAQTVCLRSHALLKAQAKDYVQAMQMWLIVQSILARLPEIQCGNENLKQLQILNLQQLQTPLQPGYFAGNDLNLLSTSAADLSYLDFSNLTIWQADLQKMNLHETNFSHAVSYSIFTQSISDTLCVAFTLDPKHIATSHDSGEGNVWRVENGQRTATFRGIASWINSLVFSPDDETLIINNADRIVKLLPIGSGKVRGELNRHTSAVLSVAISADGRLLANGGEAGGVKIWDMQTKECPKTLRENQGWLSSLVFIPSAQTPAKIYLLTSGRSDRPIWLWDVQSGHLHIFAGHTQGVLGVAFSPDGRQIASSSVKRTIRLWESQIVTLQGHTSPICSVAFKPEGQIVNSSKDGTIRLWDSWTGDWLRVLSVERSYEKMNIPSLTGLTYAQKETLGVLSAIES